MGDSAPPNAGSNEIWAQECAKYHRTGTLNMGAVVTAYMDDLGNDHLNVLRSVGVPLRQLLPEPGLVDDIFKCRVPLPAAVPAIFVYKAQGSHVWPHFRVNEIASNLKAKEYSERDGQYQHVRIPEVYCYDARLSTNDTDQENVYLCSEYFPNTIPYSERYPWGCRDWTFRQKRAFVRQMALFRLQTMSNRGDYIGGNTFGTINEAGYHVSTDILKQKIGQVKMGQRIASKFYKNLGRVSSQREWARQCLKRERCDITNTPDDVWRSERSEEASYAQKAGIPRAEGQQSMERPQAKRALEDLLDFARTRKFREINDEIPGDLKFCMTHNDMRNGFNVMMDHSKRRIISVIDWEMSMMVPYSYAVSDIFQPSNINEISNWLDAADRAPFDISEGFRSPIQEYLGDVEERINEIGGDVGTRDFSSYGDLTPSDLYLGDRYAEEDPDEPEQPDPPEKFYRTDKAWDPEDGPNYLDSVIWYYRPVLHLIDTYMQKYHGVDPTQKYLDPFVALYCKDIDRAMGFTYLGYEG